MADEQQKTAAFTASPDSVGDCLALTWVAVSGAADVDQRDEAVAQDNLVDYHFWLAHALDGRTST
jgi:hypothetical protein